MDKFITAICVFLLATTCSATTCPSIKDIKSKTLTGWIAYDSDDGKKLSSERITEFKKFVDQFALAEWSTTDKKPGSVHCYYRDKTGSVLEAYLAKDNLSPAKNSNLWYEASNAMDCAAGNDKCQFIEMTQQPAQQLARK